MGLQTDTLAAASAAAELEQGTHEQVTAVEDLDRLIVQGRDQLTLLVESGEASLRDLQTLLSNMDTALTGGFARFEEGAEALDGRVRDTRKSMLAELDASEKAINELLPKAQEALQVVEKAVKSAESKLQSLSAENARLVSLSEQKATDAEARARAMLTTVQSQREELGKKMAALGEAWPALSSQLDSQFGHLQAAFDAASATAATAVKGLLENFATGASQTNSGVRATLVETTAEEMSKLSADLGQHLVELRELGKRPRQLVEEDLVALIKRLHEITEAARLGTIERVHKKAMNLELFDF